MHYDKICKRAAIYSRGAYKPSFQPGMKNKGDQVIIVNAEKVRFKGRELLKRKYFYHTGAPGGLKEFTYR